jgi:putative aminopeptidase FrvX
MHPDPRLALLLALTQIPTASGREQRVVAFIDAWLRERPGMVKATDKAGNIVLTLPPAPKAKGRAPKGAKPAPKRPPLFITGHLDHPAFVVERVVAPGVFELSFRGGVLDVFFEHAPVTLHTGDHALSATLTGPAGTETPAGKHYLAELDHEADIVGPGAQVVPGDIATWRMPKAEIDGAGVVHTHACDDLAAVAAALCAFDALYQQRLAGQQHADVRVLLTRAEEIGFVGAIGACKLRTIPKGARVVALENSRAFAESPVGAGPIVRVGDRLSVFTPWLTGACAQRAEEIFGGASTPRASQTSAQAAARPWQRKLMAGGACEASVFCHSGYDATCLCLPLGNYHNMPHLAELQAGTYERERLGPPRAAREFIHSSDYIGLIDLLVALGQHLPEPSWSKDSPARTRFDKLYADRAYVLGAIATVEPKPKPARTRAAKAARRPVKQPAKRAN